MLRRKKRACLSQLEKAAAVTAAGRGLARGGRSRRWVEPHAPRPPAPPPRATPSAARGIWGDCYIVILAKELLSAKKMLHAHAL